MKLLKHNMPRGSHIKILLIGYLGADNFGDECMLREFINLFRDCDGIHFTIFSLGTNYDSDRITTAYCPREPFHMKKEYLRALSGVDAVVWVGGNCFTDHDNNGGFFQIILAKLLGKKFYYCGVGIDKLEKTVRIVKSYLAILLADGLIVRDSFSLEKVRDWTSHKEVLWYGSDLGEAYLSAQRNKYRCTEEYIVVSWRELSKNIGCTAQMTIIDQLAEYLVKLCRETNKKIIVFNSDQTMDRAVNMQLLIALKSKGISNVRYAEETTLEEKLEILAAAFCIITGRLHTAVAGYVFEKPVMLFNYSQKIVEFAQDKPSVFMVSEAMVEMGDFQNYLYSSTRNNQHTVSCTINFDFYNRFVDLLTHMRKGLL